MSGWMDWYEDKVICPFCGQLISVMLVEECEGEFHSPIAISIAGGCTICAHCGNKITDQDLLPNNGGEDEINS